MLWKEYKEVMKIWAIIPLLRLQNLLKIQCEFRKKYPISNLYFSGACGVKSSFFKIIGFLRLLFWIYHKFLEILSMIKFTIYHVTLKRQFKNPLIIPTPIQYIVNTEMVKWGTVTVFLLFWWSKSTESLAWLTMSPVAYAAKNRGFKVMAGLVASRKPENLQKIS